jgi:hypothetical protein
MCQGIGVVARSRRYRIREAETSHVEVLVFWRLATAPEYAPLSHPDKRNLTFHHFDQSGLLRETFESIVCAND